ncbi:hypothetical protein C1645_882089 [Glomus cerebriforme]|uniref:Protein kinase domain-containing protein n=1 Tax=Glomus cerebriforme TaxID=658196 RepID=A0A397S2E3_9GLOM|nr:hypothetical protein C1645_882089 [Glomus cerebriforme]
MQFNWASSIKFEKLVFEWISYNQFCEIKEISKEISKGDFSTIYSAIRKDGPLFLSWDNEYKRGELYQEVILKCLNNTQNIDALLNNVKAYLNKYLNIYYGISQNPDTKNYILVQNNFLCESGNKQIDDFIQQMQSKVNNENDMIFEWIPYNRFDEIKEIGKGGFSAVYSAIWKDGPLLWNTSEYVRESNKKIALKCLDNSQNINEFLNEVLIFSTNFNDFSFFSLI